MSQLVRQVKGAILVQDLDALLSLVVHHGVGTSFPLWTKTAGALKIPLVYAFRKGSVRAFEKLLQLGHDVNVEVAKGDAQIPLFYGVFLPIGQRTLFLDAALRHGLDIERAKRPVAEGRSFLANILSLSTATDIREMEVWVEYLARRFEALGVPIGMDNTADFDCPLLFFAAVEESLPLLGLFKEKGVDLNADFATLKDTNAFVVALVAKKMATCLWLLNNGALSTQQTKAGLERAKAMFDMSGADNHKNIVVLRNELRARAARDCKTAGCPREQTNKKPVC